MNRVLEIMSDLRPGAVRGDASAVGTPWRAMPPRAVAGHVDEHPVARLSRADAEPLVLASPDDQRQSGRASCTPPLGEPGVGRVEVDVPRPVVVADEHRRTPVVGKQVVRLQRGG